MVALLGFLLIVALLGAIWPPLGGIFVIVAFGVTVWAYQSQTPEEKRQRRRDRAGAPRDPGWY